MTASDDHRFGGPHTQTKLDILRDYLPAYTTALSKQHFRLHYVDAFAGTGTCRIQTPDGERVIPGSAQIALDCTPRFHQLHFIEKRARSAKALRELAERRPDTPIDVKVGDANQHLPRVLAQFDRSRDRVVTLLDPYGMAVSWSTLEAVAKHNSDVWYLFPLSGLYRQVATQAVAIDADKRAAITRLLGTSDWYEAFYRPSPQSDLFGPTSDVREADVGRIVDFVSARLTDAFAWASAPMLLYQTRQDGARGAPLFALYFAMGNPSPPAIALAKKLANSIMARAAALRGTRPTPAHRAGAR